jgi:hypothetical protein
MSIYNYCICYKNNYNNVTLYPNDMASDYEALFDDKETATIAGKEEISTYVTGRGAHNPKNTRNYKKRELERFDQ